MLSFRITLTSFTWVWTWSSFAGELEAGVWGFVSSYEKKKQHKLITTSTNSHWEATTTSVVTTLNDQRSLPASEITGKGRWGLNEAWLSPENLKHWGYKVNVVRKHCKVTLGDVKLSNKLWFFFLQQEQLLRWKTGRQCVKSSFITHHSSSDSLLKTGGTNEPQRKVRNLHKVLLFSPSSSPNKHRDLCFSSLRVKQ